MKYEDYINHYNYCIKGRRHLSYAIYILYKYISKIPESDITLLKHDYLILYYKAKTVLDGWKDPELKRHIYNIRSVFIKYKQSLENLSLMPTGSASIDYIDIPTQRSFYELVLREFEFIDNNSLDDNRCKQLKILMKELYAFVGTYRRVAGLYYAFNYKKRLELLPLKESIITEINSAINTIKKRKGTIREELKDKLVAPKLELLLIDIDKWDFSNIGSYEFLFNLQILQFIQKIPQ